MLEIRRRRILQFSAVAVASAAVGFQLGRLSVGDANARWMPRELAGLVSEEHFSPQVGAAYLESIGSGLLANPNRLVQEIMAVLDENDLEGSIRLAAAQDFREGRLCELEGWRLSETECRLAAIVHLHLVSTGRVATPAPARGPLDDLPSIALVKVARWGPQIVYLNETFNEQPGGSSAVWVGLAEPPRLPGAMLYLADQATEVTVNADKSFISGNFRPSQTEQLVSRPGQKALYLVDPAQGQQLIGYVTVRAR